MGVGRQKEGLNLLLGLEERSGVKNKVAFIIFKPVFKKFILVNRIGLKEDPQANVFKLKCFFEKYFVE